VGRDDIVVGMTALAVVTSEETPPWDGLGRALAVIAGDIRNGFAFAITSGIGRTGRWPRGGAAVGRVAATVTGLSVAIVAGRLDMPVSTGRDEQPAPSRRQADADTDATRRATGRFTIDPP
jgi:hypothetical protein